MCLYRLSDKPKELPAYKQRVGWKIFERASTPKGYLSRTRLNFTSYHLDGEALVPRGVWLKARATTTISPSHGNKRYVPLFHIYLEKPKRHSSRTQVVKVRWKSPHITTGYELGVKPTVIALHMYVPKPKARRKK